MKSPHTIWLVATKNNKFPEWGLSKIAYSDLEKAVEFVENRLGNPKPIEGENLLWSNGEDQYKLYGITLIE